MKNNYEYKKKETSFEIKTWVIGMVLFFAMFITFSFVDLGNYQWIIMLIGLGAIFLYFFISGKKRVSLYKEYHAGETEIIPLNKPLLNGGANFANRKILFDNNQAYTKYTWFGFILKNIFLAVGSVLLVVAIYKIFFSNDELIIPVAFLATIFTLLGSMIKFSSSKQINFDKAAGIFYLGKRNNEKAKQNAESLQNIKEIQIINKSVRVKNGNSFTCYEVNIVLQDNRRFNVLNHGKHRKILEDAQKLSSFLNIPISNLSGLSIDGI